jgi:hypothetical protein
LEASRHCHSRLGSARRGCGNLTQPISTSKASHFDGTSRQSECQVRPREEVPQCLASPICHRPAAQMLVAVVDHVAVLAERPATASRAVPSLPIHRRELRSTPRAGCKNIAAPALMWKGQRHGILLLSPVSTARCHGARCRTLLDPPRLSFRLQRANRSLGTGMRTY